MKQILPLLLVGAIIFLPSDQKDSVNSRSIDAKESEGYAAFIVNSSRESEDTKPDNGGNACECNGTKRITHGDGHQTKCPCDVCDCKQIRASQSATNCVCDCGGNCVCENGVCKCLVCGKECSSGGVCICENGVCKCTTNTKPQTVKQKSTPKYYIAKFTATWCAPCKTWDATERGKLTSRGIPVYDYDVDENKEIAEKHNVQSIPYFLLVDAETSKIVKRFSNESAETIYSEMVKISQGK